MCAIDIRPAIATERLVLRGAMATDAERIAELANDIGVAGMTSNIPHPYGKRDALDFLARPRDPQREVHFVVEHRQHGPIGGLGFNASDDLGPELGYWLGRPYWGQGYATEAARAALRWAGGAWRKKVVVAGHFPENRASGEVLVKAGFLYTGVVKTRPSKARGKPMPTRMMVWLA